MLADRLDKTLTIATRGTAKDAIGAISANQFTNRATGVACCMWPARATTRDDFARRDMVAEFEIVTVVDIAAAADERITIGGKNYTVIGYLSFSLDSLVSSPLYVTVTGKRNQ